MMGVQLQNVSYLFTHIFTLIILFKMGKFHNGVLGTMTGKVGGVVGRTWKGINTVASYQPNVSNPQTNAQMAQRGKLSALTTLASQINTGFIKPLWDRDAKKMSGFNAFIQANIANVSDLGVIDFSKLVASKGKMVAPADLAAVYTASDVVVTWDSAVSDSYGLATDLCYLFITDSSGNVVATSSGQVARSAGTLTVAHSIQEDGLYYSFLAFRRLDGSISSASTWASKLVSL